jgi:hypothetical protein
MSGIRWEVGIMRVRVGTDAELGEKAWKLYESGTLAIHPDSTQEEIDEGVSRASDYLSSCSPSPIVIVDFPQLQLARRSGAG